MVDAENQQSAGEAEEEDYSKEVSTVEVLDNRVVIVPPSHWWLFFSLLAVVLFLVVWSSVGELTKRVEGWGIIGSKGAQLLSVDAPRHGMVRRVLAETGDFVQEGEGLLEIGEQAGRHFQVWQVRAPLAAKVVIITTEAGRHVEEKEVLLRLRTHGESLLAHIFLPFQDWQQVRVGQQALLHAYGAQAIEGKIVSVAQSPQPRHKIIMHWGEGVTLPQHGDTFYEVIFSLDQPLATNPTQRGYSWMLPNSEQLSVGMQRKFSITVRKYSLLSLMLPWLGEARS